MKLSTLAKVAHVAGSSPRRAPGARVITAHTTRTRVPRRPRQRQPPRVLGGGDTALGPSRNGGSVTMETFRCRLTPKAPPRLRSQPSEAPAGVRGALEILASRAQAEPCSESAGRVRAPADSSDWAVADVRVALEVANGEAFRLLVLHVVSSIRGPFSLAGSRDCE